jgi:hypothetical protein
MKFSRAISRVSVELETKFQTTPPSLLMEMEEVPETMVLTRHWHGRSPKKILMHSALVPCDWCDGHISL